MKNAVPKWIHDETESCQLLRPNIVLVLLMARHTAFLRNRGLPVCLCTIKRLKEQSRVILARRDYLWAKLANRNPDGTLKHPEVYLDETYISKNHSSPFTWYLDDDGPLVNKPSGVGPRLIVVHAVTKDGWVEGAQRVLAAKKRTGDYHGQMNWDNFSRWFKLRFSLKEGIT